MQKTLVNRDSKGKIRVVDISCNWCDQEHAYILERYTCQYMGKVTKHADIIINKGKAGRTVTEQAKQEYASHVKKYMDKGFDLEDAVRETIGIIHGAYAIAAVSKNEPDKIVAARKGSPLVIGVGNGENLIASDIPAVLEYTKKVILKLFFY